MSRLEDLFADWLHDHPDLNGWVREHRFHPTRRWRFDFAWPQQKVAVEVEGVAWQGRARHQTATGFVADCEKYEAALLHGWTVYRVPGPWIEQQHKLVRRPQVMDTLRRLLKVDNPVDKTEGS